MSLSFGFLKKQFVKSNQQMTKKLIFNPRFFSERDRTFYNILPNVSEAHKTETYTIGGAVKEHELLMQYFQICSSSVLLNDGQIMSTLIYVSNRIKHKT